MAPVEPGGANLSCETLDCLEIMSEVYRALEVPARDRGLVFTADTSVNLPSIVADRARLIEVLLHLGNNAIKYNIDGGWVLLSAAPRAGMVRFFVRDTGVGIASERHAQVFEPAGRAGSEPGSGRGPVDGLPGSRRLVRAMQGEIGLESVPGSGSTFWIDIPVASDEAAATAAAATKPVTVPSGAGYKILYVEDKIPNVELMHDIIEEIEGAHCIDAQTVQDGIRIASSLKPDLVIADIHLPDGTGFDVLQRLRADPETAHIPVIALTGDAMPTNLANMQRYGFNQIITKPFEVGELLRIIRATLKAS